MVNGPDKVSPTLVCTLFFFVLSLSLLFVFDPVIPSSEKQAAAFVLAYSLTACPHVAKPGTATQLTDESTRLGSLLGISKNILRRPSKDAGDFPCYDQKLMWKAGDELSGAEKDYYMLGSAVAEYEWLTEEGAHAEMAETKSLMFQVPELSDPERAQAATQFCTGALTAGEFYGRLFARTRRSKIPVLLDIHGEGPAE